jgi:hypothetical protein
MAMAGRDLAPSFGAGLFFWGFECMADPATVCTCAEWMAAQVTGAAST